MIRTVLSRADAESLPILWREGSVLARLAHLMDYWKNLCVPHVYLGTSSREMDMAVVTPARRLWCIEVKLSLADWKRDLTKQEYPASVRPTRFYYAAPASLVTWHDDPVRPWRSCPDLPDWIPAHAGILWLTNERIITTGDNGHCQVEDRPHPSGAIRPAKSLHRQPLSDRHYLELLQKLGNQYWRHVAERDTPTPLRVELTP
jgi:hypothetical protein